MAPPPNPPASPQALQPPWLAEAHTIRRAVRIDVRRVVLSTLLWGLAIALLLAIPFMLHYRAETHAFKDAREAEKDRVIRLAAEIAQRELDNALSDLRFLSQSNAMRALMAADTPASRRALGREFLGLARQKGLYDQIRLIGVDGREKVRINHAEGQPFVVPEPELQKKGDRPYFRAAAQLSFAQIHVSPFDLNVERGKLEEPYKPVIRLAMPIADARGRARGVLVLNYLGQRLLDRLAGVGGEPGSLWLMDARGYWMLGPTREDAWGAVVPGRQASSLALRDPALWRHMSEREVGTYSAAGDWIQFQRIHPLAPRHVPVGNHYATPVAGRDYVWIVATALPGSLLQTGYLDAAKKLGFIYGAWSLFGFVLAGGLAFLGNRNASLAHVMENVIDNLPVLIAYVDEEQRYRFNNMAYERFFGQSPKELFGRTLREVLGDEAYLQVRPHVEQALAGQLAVFERRLPYARAGTRHVSVSYIPAIRAGGRLQGFYVLVNDVTPIKDSERRERQRMLELAHVSRLASLGEMATEIAHEINQPLAAIAMYSAACLRTLGPASGQVSGWLEAINIQAKRAGEVVRHLRRFVRKGDIQLGPVNLNQVAKDVAGLIHFDADRQNVRIELDLATEMPDLSAELILVEQVLFNLLRNAMEAMEGTAGERRIVVRTRIEADRACVEVADTGPGVSPDLGARIFESFTTDKRDGLGMGLAISRSIVEAHGGTLGYVDNPGGGATFRCCLPREIKHEQ